MLPLALERQLQLQLSRRKQCFFFFENYDHVSQRQVKRRKKLQFLRRTTYELLTKGHLAFIYSGQSEGVLSMRLLDSGRKLKTRNLLGSLYQVNLTT